jgi:hypothetical protein
MSVSRSITVEFECRRMFLPLACVSLRLKRRNGLLTASAIQPLPPTRSSPDSLWPARFRRGICEAGELPRQRIEKWDGDQVIDPYAMTMAPLIASRLWNQPQTLKSIQPRSIARFAFVSVSDRVARCQGDVYCCVQVDMNGPCLLAVGPS